LNHLQICQKALLNLTSAGKTHKIAVQEKVVIGKEGAKVQVKVSVANPVKGDEIAR